MIKILAIDDKQDNLITVKAILKMNLSDCQILTAQSGKEGINMVINQDPDAILLDIKMPGMDGYEVCKELKSNLNTRHIPVIMLTAMRSDSIERAKAFDIGADAFLSKPIDATELTAQIKAMLRIKTAEDKLRAKNVILEDLVAKKTRELSEKNKRLENEIVENKKNSVKLKENEARLSIILNSFDEPVYLVSPNFELIFGNEVMKRKYGENILGQPCYKIIYNKNSQCPWCLFSQLSTENRIDKYEHYFENEDKHKIVTNILLEDKSKLSIHFDISKRKKAEEALAISEHQFRFMAENAQDLIYRMRIPEGTYEYVSPASVRIFGYKPEDFYANPLIIKDIIHSDFYNYFNEQWEKLCKSEMLPYYEYKIIDKAGNEKWLNQRNADVRDGKGNIIAIEASITDVTKRKNMEQELIVAKEMAEESRAMFQAALEHSQAGIAIADVPTGELKYVNEAGLFIRGKKHNEIVKNIDVNKYVASWKILHLDGTPYETDEVPLARAVLYGEKSTREFIIRRDNNENRYVLAKAGPVYNEKGKQIAAIVVFMDITMRKQAEQSLKENETKLKNIIENSTNLFYSHSANNEITFISPQVSEYLGYEQEEVMQNWTNFVSDNPINKKAIEFTKKAIQTGKRQPTYELEMVRKDGSKIIVEVREAPVFKDGGEVSIVGSLSDITERKKAEIRLKKAKEKAEESDRLKTAFLANMSHEIRTPLNAVLGFSEILATETSIDSSEKKTLAKYIKINGNSLAKIIDDIIDVSKIESKQMKVKVQDFNLHLILDELQQYYNSQLSQKQKTKVKLKLVTEYSLTEPFFLKTDGQRLKQILNNLISNAMKYTDDGYITFGYQMQNHELKFFVNDTGCGISTKNLEAIFNRFVQISNKYISRHEGTGLGLAISRNLVHLLGGKLKVESKVNKGSSFYFSIPLVRGKANVVKKDNGKTTIKSSDIKQLRILIADDEESNYMLSKRILKPSGAKTEWAENGKQAVEMVEHSKFDLVLMDIKMPVMDGIEATRIIKKQYPEIPVIIQTAYAMRDVQEEAIKAKCDGFIIKPISIDSFLEIVAKHLK